MRFVETHLKGAFRIELECREDERGFFARTFCKTEFSDHGLETQIEQSSISFNTRKGTLRGMHFQAAPFEECKLIRCTRGAIFDAIIDLRPESRTFKQHFAIELSAQAFTTLYVPRGFAHGFLTLADETEVSYLMSEAYVPEAGRGVRWNDQTFAIKWPAAPLVVSERDRNYPDFSLAVLNA